SLSWREELLVGRDGLEQAQGVLGLAALGGLLGLPQLLAPFAPRLDGGVVQLQPDHQVLAFLVGQVGGAGLGLLEEAVGQLVVAAPVAVDGGTQGYLIPRRPGRRGGGRRRAGGRRLGLGPGLGPYQTQEHANPHYCRCPSHLGLLSPVRPPRTDARCRITWSATARCPFRHLAPLSPTAAGRRP